MFQGLGTNTFPKPVESWDPEGHPLVVDETRKKLVPAASITGFLELR